MTRDRGFALLTVLWGTALLSGIAASLIADSRTEARISRNLVSQATAQAAADGAVRLAIARLAAGREGLRLDSTPVAVELDGRRLPVAIQDVGGLVDINAAPAPLIAAAFRAAGLTPAEANAAAAAAVARREDARLPGAPALGAFTRARRPYEMVGDLADLPGMTPALLAAVTPFVTVQSRRTGVDPRVAPETVLLALPGAEPEGVAAFLGRRGGREEPPAALLRTQAFHSTSFGDVFRVSAEASGPGGVTPVRRVAVVRLTGQPDDPVWIHDWGTR